ncbi:protein of unknown function [Cardinium endosymbiont cEper1 of Encarsia pergandiella]|nr:protein of unknown function [Cardinium endosymbiont cEper1 of Encarsia pergandiella]
MLKPLQAGEQPKTLYHKPKDINLKLTHRLQILTTSSIKKQIITRGKVKRI